MVLSRRTRWTRWLLSAVLLGGIAILLGIFFLEGGHEVSVVSSGTSHGINSTSGRPIGVTDIFGVGNPSVYSWITIVRYLPHPCNLTFQWFTPQGTVYRVWTIYAPGRLSSDGIQNETFSDSIKLNGAVAGQLVGDWEVTIHINGQPATNQRLTVEDPTVPAQSVRPVPWPFSTVAVHVEPEPGYAREAVVAAMTQWNYSQAWFASEYPHSSNHIYRFALSGNASSQVTVTFNQTVTAGYTSDSRFSIERPSNSSRWAVSCSVSLVLSLRNGTRLNEVFIENSALLQFGYCLGLGQMTRSGDLMNPASPNVYDLNTPSTLNLYSLDQLSANSNRTSPQPYYLLPQSIPYAASPFYAGQQGQPYADLILTAGTLLTLSGLSVVILVSRRRRHLSQIL